MTNTTSFSIEQIDLDKIDELKKEIKIKSRSEFVRRSINLIYKNKKLLEEL